MCQEDAPGFVLVPVVPAVSFRQLDRGAGAGGEGDLVDLAGSLDREAAWSAVSARKEVKTAA